MSDESFFREVNEDLRSQRARDFWARFGWMIITAVVVIIAATAGWRGYEYWQARQASQSGDAFLQALTLAEEGRSDEALTALSELEETGVGAYPLLSRMRAATLKAESGDFEAAIADFTEIGSTSGGPEALRQIANLRAAYLLVDHGTYEEVLAVAEPMTGDDHPMRHSAREAAGLAAWKAGDMEAATDWFERIAADEAAVRGPAERAELMLELIASAGPDGTLPPSAPAADAQPEADAPTPDAPISLESIAPALAPTAPDTGDAAAPAADPAEAPAEDAEPVEAPAEDAAPAPADEGAPAGGGAPQTDTNEADPS